MYLYRAIKNDFMSLQVPTVAKEVIVGFGRPSRTLTSRRKVRLVIVPSFGRIPCM